MEQTKQVKQYFSYNHGYIERRVVLERDGNKEMKFFDMICVSGKRNDGNDKDKTVHYFRQRLDAAFRSDTRKRKKANKKEITLGSVFSGCGGLDMGIHEALIAMGLKPILKFAIDSEQKPLDVLKSNLLDGKDESSGKVICGDLTSLVKYKRGRGACLNVDPAEVELDPSLEEFVGKIDLLSGGPPCKDFSSVNVGNRKTNTARNDLYYMMPVLAVKLQAENVIIENVRNVRSQGSYAKFTMEYLRRHDYEVKEMTINAADYGVAQKRRRFVIVASRNSTRLEHLDAFMEGMKLESGPITFREVNADLSGLDFEDPRCILDRAPKSKPVTVARFKAMDDKGLPIDHETRPDCHKRALRKGQRNTTIYGKIQPDEPTGTITTSFANVGAGRGTHPAGDRGLTSREGARLQAFPDRYWKGTIGNGFNLGDYRAMIGNAVPPVMIIPVVVGLFADDVDSLVFRK